MDASELKIGNHVTTLSSGDVKLPTGITEKIGNIGFFGVHLYDYKKPFSPQIVPRSTPIKDLIPIELTEKWAEQNATVINRKDGDTTYEFEYSNGMLSLRFYEGKAYWLANMSMKVDLPYVHLWQNLFFYLTQGEELKI